MGHSDPSHRAAAGVSAPFSVLKFVNIVTHPELQCRANGIKNVYIVCSLTLLKFWDVSVPKEVGLQSVESS